ncbi:PREDICTED: TSK-associating protein 1-like [Camelina sativa]|uniref:TSK-associating protein 1-like n=1 Tax=Camelina sativa TaxID=90675 RepID=A0ABM1R5Q1_CAMSA|nr:PREDICTED: TSK-associating protein 1-like [Camelina sativa]
MLEEIEREFEAAIGGLKQIQVDDSRNIEEESAKRKVMLEEIDREFEEAHSGISANYAKEERKKKKRQETLTISVSLTVSDNFVMQFLFSQLQRNRVALFCQRFLDLDT